MCLGVCGDGTGWCMDFVIVEYASLWRISLLKWRVAGEMCGEDLKYLLLLELGASCC